MRAFLVAAAVLSFCACPKMTTPDSGVGGGLGGGFVGSGGGTGGGTGGGAGGGTADSGVGTPGSLIGHQVSYFRVGAADLARPNPDPSASISVFVPQPGGTFTSRPVSNTGDGGFRVDGLDGGDVYVRFAKDSQVTFFVTANTFINLDDYTLGRPGTLLAEPSTATVTASNMLLTDTPDFVVVAPNTGFNAFVFPDSAPSAATTSLLDEPSQVDVVAGGFPDGTAGDPAWLIQMLPFDAGDLQSPDGGSFFLIATSAMRGAPLTGLRLGVDGGSISGVFQSAATPEAVQLTVDGEWAAHFGEMIDGGGTGQNFSASVYPAPNAPGLSPQWVGYSGMLVDFFADRPLSQFSVLMPYVNPYPPEWKLIFAVSATGSQRTRLPGTTSGLVSASLYDSRLLTPVASPLPRVLPPRITLVEGSNGILASLTPQVSWQAGAGMAPNAWTVAVIHLSVSGTATVRKTEATVFTSRTSARIPPGVLVSGETYVLRVTAVLVPGEDVLTNPHVLLGAFDEATAQTITGLWRAP